MCVWEGGWRWGRGECVCVWEYTLGNYLRISSVALQTASSINTMLERADYVYKILVQHRNDLDQLLGSLAGGIIVSPGAVSYYCAVFYSHYH